MFLLTIQKSQLKDAHDLNVSIPITSQTGDGKHVTHQIYFINFFFYWSISIQSLISHARVLPWYTVRMFTFIYSFDNLTRPSCTRVHLWYVCTILKQFSFLSPPSSIKTFQLCIMILQCIMFTSLSYSYRPRYSVLKPKKQKNYHKIRIIKNYYAALICVRARHMHYS